MVQLASVRLWLALMSLRPSSGVPPLAGEASPEGSRLLATAAKDVEMVGATLCQGSGKPRLIVAEPAQDRSASVSRLDKLPGLRIPHAIVRGVVASSISERDCASTVDGSAGATSTHSSAKVASVTPDRPLPLAEVGPPFASAP